jgi:phosphoglycerate dehydrogenase-like enzyme
MPVVYVSDPIDEGVLRDLQSSADVRLGFGSDAVDYEDVSADVEAVLLRTPPFTEDMIKASPKLKIIARHGVGTDNVDLEAAQKAGVVVTSTPGANSRAVAEHVFALLLALARHVTEADRRVRSGHWGEGKPELTGFQLAGRTLGIVGFGDIGRIVLAIAQGFGMTVLISDPNLDEDMAGDLDVPNLALEDLLRRADVVTLHAPLSSSTRDLIGRPQLALMKPAAVLINTSRGGLVDEVALVQALREERLAGAALDVLDGEDVDASEPLPHSRIDLDTPGLIVTPHIAGQTQESLEAMGSAAWKAIQDVLAGRAPEHPVRP